MTRSTRRPSTPLSLLATITLSATVAIAGAAATNLPATGAAGGIGAPLAAVAPAASFSISATVTSPSSVTVTWDASSKPRAGWRVGRDGIDKDGYGPWSTQVSGSTSTQTFGDLVTGSTYTFTVKNLTTGESASTTLTMGAPSPTPKPTATPKPTPTPKPTATPTAPPTNPPSGWKVGQRSKLGWDLGVFAHNPDRAKRFEKAVGRAVDVYQVAPQREEGFGEMLSETRRIMRYVPADAKVDLAVPLLSYDEAKQLGEVLQSTGHGDAYVRPGWEFNLTGSWPWTVDNIGYDSYISKFRESARGFRAAAPNVKMEWNPNAKTKGFQHAVKAYPGDAYVDVIGVDVYNWSYEDSWTGDGGLDQWLAFAKQHGKKMTLPEWGVHGGRKGSGDNPAYVTKMLTWINTNRDTVVFASYFDETDSYIKNSIADGQMPRSREAFRAALATM